MALSIAMEQDKQFRESLPTDYMEYMGIIHSADVSGKYEVCLLPTIILLG